LLTAALHENSKLPNAHSYLGLALERKRRFPEATAALRKELELNARHADAYAALSRIYKARGDQRRAQEAWAKAVDLNPRLKR